MKGITHLLKDKTVYTIPLNQMRVTGDNPRGAHSRQEVEALAASLKIDGQLVPVLLRVRTPEELASADPDQLYDVLGGQLRWEAAPLAGLESLNAYKVEADPKQARRIAILDNVRKDMNWLSWMVTAETLKADDPTLGQDEIGNLLAKDQAWVSKALKLLKLLNKSARKAIYENIINPCDDEMPEACAHALTALAKGNEGDLALIESALTEVLIRHLDLKKTGKLVLWIQQGNSPESFPEDGSLKAQKGSKQQNFDPTDPLADQWKALPKRAQVRQTPKGYQFTCKHLSPDEARQVAQFVAGLLKNSKETPAPKKVVKPVSPEDKLKILQHKVDHGTLNNADRLAWSPTAARCWGKRFCFPWPKARESWP